MRLSWATAADAAAMAAAHAGAFDAAWREEDFEDLMDGEGVFGFVAFDAAEAAIGVILCRAVLDEVEVLTIGVARDVRRQGVAKALMSAAMGAAREAGARICFLEVAVDNDPAAALYAGLGFRRAGLRKRYYDRGPAGMVDALVMRRDLNDAPA
jgi:ribosomal-protein-alanine N-acetyltransferase